MEAAQLLKKRRFEHVAGGCGRLRQAEDEITQAIGLVSDEGDAVVCSGKLANPIGHDAIRLS